MLFEVTTLGKTKVILGHTWLKKHNPTIDWTTGEVSMNRCPAECNVAIRADKQAYRLGVRISHLLLILGASGAFVALLQYRSHPFRSERVEIALRFRFWPYLPHVSRIVPHRSAAPLHSITYILLYLMAV
ncbi:hypothetical protein BD779DRAFT_1438811 [Infundibulicybe gibba]|nr:hypothetical protein BD779DRAFT_1438811 [Infundibulicybe gibba]